MEMHFRLAPQVVENTIPNERILSILDCSSNQYPMTVSNLQHQTLSAEAEYKSFKALLSFYEQYAERAGNGTFAFYPPQYMLMT